ncbi:protein of unknown function DUF87 [Lacrimispora sphenoides]|uniref:VirB4 family type IV secretion system protein n=1 Tax=Lacrimispora sphenoides TaxID=29370 RepID=UPI0008CBA802|nr:DUF87 domain-containing protein [Lacrimispora sphenoides]SEU22239.1 protein of unknown function DUF87 [Lacrimispora sphenoides]
MVKKTENQIVSYDLDINTTLLNIITPSAIDHDRSFLNISESVGRVMCISKFPSYTNYGWLAPIAKLESTITKIEYRHTSPERITKALNNKISELRENLDAAKKESERQSLEYSIENLMNLIDRITVKGEPVGFVNIMLYISAENTAELASRIRRIQSIISIQECGVRPLVHKQLLAFQAMAPYGLPNYEMVSNMGERAMPISTLLGGFPNASSGLYDEKGYFLGKTKDLLLVILNQWIRNKDRTNSNWVVTGVPGVGKSTVLKVIFAKENWTGTKIIIFDPEREYVDLANSDYINGDVIDCATGINGRINPLQVRAVCQVKAEDLDEGESLGDYFTFDIEDELLESQLALYIQQLRLFFSLYFGKEDYNAELKTILEQTLIDLYERFDITWDTDVTNIPNDKFPTMRELYDYAKERAEKEDNLYIKAIRDKLVLKLYSSAYGADQFIWNGYTTLDTKSDFIDLDVSKLLDLDDNVKRAQFCNLTSWSWQQMSADRTERVLFGVDEGYLFVDPDYPDMMKYLRNISKRARKYEGGLMFITHSIVDILDPAVKRYGQAIIDSACYKFIMGTDGKNLKETQELFNLSDKEVNILSAKSRGQGVFMCGNMRINMTVDVSDEMLAIFGSAGGR